MRKTATALLIFHNTKPCNDLAAALGKIAIPVERVKGLGEARRVLSRVNPPLLVFTESELPDGNWADVVSLVARTPSPVSLIVVGEEVDTKLYASVIEVGAFDFIVPPFNAAELTYVVRCAADNASARREVARKVIVQPKRRQVPGYTGNQL
jgi:DNA-binding NtrC family response regulator